MTRAYDKTEHLSRASSLLLNDDLSSLRYACLEMRYFLEAHVYERLLSGADEIPKSIFQRWEPNKAMKMLSMFDELSDMDLQVTISERDGSNPISIKYNNIKNPELSRYYNTLGSFLHLPQPAKIKDFTIVKAKILKIHTALSRLLDGNLIIIKTAYENFECEKCGATILYTQKFVENHDRIHCQDTNCNTLHFIEHEAGRVKFGARILVPCSGCNLDMSVFYSDLEFEAEIHCENCPKSYVVRPTLQITGE